MVYVFLGDDRYTKKTEAKRIAQQQGAIFVFVELHKKDQWEPFKERITTPSLFGDPYLFYLSEFELVSAHVQTNAFRYIGFEAPKKPVSIIIDYNGAKANPLFEPFSSFRYDLPKPWKQAEWIEKTVRLGKLNGLSLDSGQATLVFERCGPDPEKIANELLKVRAVSAEGRIEEDLLNALVFPYQPENLEDFIFSIIGQDYPAVFRSLYRVFSEYSENLILFRLIQTTLSLAYLVAHHRKRLSQFEDLREISKSTGLHIPTLSRFYGYSFDRTKKLRNLVLAYRAQSVSVILDELWQIDYANKSEGQSIFKNMIAFLDRLSQGA